MWRPDDWDNPWRQEVRLGNDRVVYESSEESAFEEGADAMLMAVRARAYIEGDSLRNIIRTLGWTHISTNSKWYSIPEEAQNESTNSS